MTKYETRLTQVEQAIEALLTGAESYTVDGVSYKRTDLSKLQTYETYLEGKVAREKSRVSKVSRCRFPSEG
ncbi:hypothetical protein [uncultured Victivallis sp.]|uniref:hypothetical protein n=1 Tax=uncultured Victivallis sp. TaxID=354118 RepID=UPI0025DB557A|nr:hypothetical protein [uncultured Victivallis sp.]